MAVVELRNPIDIGVDVPLSQVARVGDLLFLAGQAALSPDGGVVGVDDIATQTTVAIDHMRVVLADFGADLENVASVTVYLTHLTRDYAGFNQAYAAAFGDHRPPRTTVQAALALDALLVEIQVVAALEPGAG